MRYDDKVWDSCLSGISPYGEFPDGQLSFVQAFDNTKDSCPGKEENSALSIIISIVFLYLG